MCPGFKTYDLVKLSREGCLLFFDLDNTIYEETDFLFSVYRELSTHFFPESEHKAFEFLTSEFKANGHKLLYNKLVIFLGQPYCIVNDLVRFQHNFFRTNLLKPYAWFQKYCQYLNADGCVEIITNGTPQQQRNKIRSLDLRGCDVRINAHFANLYSPKPAPDIMIDVLGERRKARSYYIGDSEIDREFAANARLEFIDVASLKN